MCRNKSESKSIESSSSCHHKMFVKIFRHCEFSSRMSCCAMGTTARWLILFQIYRRKAESVTSGRKLFIGDSVRHFKAFKSCSFGDGGKSFHWKRPTEYRWIWRVLKTVHRFKAESRIENLTHRWFFVLAATVSQTTPVCPSRQTCYESS